MMPSPMIPSRRLLILLAPFLLAACHADEPKKPAMETSHEAPAPPDGKVEKSDAEWQKLLSPEQYRILREAGTERPFGQVYEEFKKQGGGTYYCAACGAELFSSKEKFDSHCGWPSFYAPTAEDHVVLREDNTLGMKRVEVLCANCGSHLGHVFDDAPQTPTGDRYCMNSVSLKLQPKES
jgi:peptide-methionine (R)-S-oxide reductase